jgi:hypothetical protein|tara:strand:+ start:949 stop:2160 length:1212 start_codon:yes stop_codon:yes gene_type:complete
VKILKLQAENLKRLVVVEINPDGNIVQISGKNGAGKTSVLDAVWWALAGADNIQKKPIREGQEKAYIMLDLGEIVVERTFTGKGSYLKVTNADGAAFQSPQKMLGSLIGKLSFDPLAFQRMKEAQQIAALQELAGVDGTPVRNANKIDYEKRRDLNRDAKSARARAEGIAVPPDVPEKLVDLSSLRDAIAEKWRENAEIEEAAEKAQALFDRIKAAEATVAKLQAERREHLSFAEQETSDVSALRAEFDAAVESNEGVRLRQERDAALGEAGAAEAEAAELTKAMELRTAAFEVAVAEADMPIEGLSIDLEQGVMFNGVPFSQASDAEQIRASMALAMAANPKIRVIRIRDGSLLDSDSLATIATMANHEDYQIWIETVDESGEIGFMLEDGMVVNQPAEAAE